MIIAESWLVGCSSVVAVVWALAVPLEVAHSRTEIQLPSAKGNLWQSDQSFRSSSNLQSSVHSHFPEISANYCFVVGF